MTGWVINLLDNAYSREVERMQPPVIVLPESNAPVFEVWFWHSEVQRWFVMSRSFDTYAQSQGVVYFDPTVDGWKDRLREVIRLLGGSDADGRNGPL